MSAIDLRETASSSEQGQVGPDSEPGPERAMAPFDPSAELPELHEAALGWDELDCVLADLDDFASIDEILGRGDRSAPQPIADVVDARDRFVRGELQGLQITYLFAEQAWVDTFVRESQGARLLRMRHQGQRR